MIGNLSTQVVMTRWVKDIAAGTDQAAVSTSAIDTGEHDRAMVTLHFGTVTSTGVCTLVVKGCDTSDGTYAKIGEIAAAAKAPTSDKTWVIDVPTEMRYIKIEYQRTTANIVIDSGDLMLYDGKRIPANSMGDVTDRIVI